MKLRRSGLIVPSLTVPNLTADFEGASPLDAFDAPTSATPPTVQSSGGQDGGAYGVWAPNLTTAFTRWRSEGGTEQSIPVGQTCWSARMYVRYPSALPNITPNPSIFSVVKPVAVDDFTFFFNIATGAFKWDLDSNDAAQSDPIVADRWYLIEARGDFRSDPWIADVRIDGVMQGSIATAGTSLDTVAFIQFGIASATQVWTGHFDDCAFAYGTSPLRFIGP